MDKKTVFKFLGYTLLIYLVVVGMMSFFQNHLIFHPSEFMTDSPDRLEVPWSDHYVETEDGTMIHGWLLKNEDAEHTVVFSHGNAGNISGRLDIAKTIYDKGVSVFLYDYRGYGNSEGSPNEDGFFDDARSVVNYLAGEQGIPTDSMIFYGRSLGGSAAAHQASEFNGAGLVLDSAFANIRSMAQSAYPFVPSFLVRAEFPTDQFLMNRGEIPVLFMHSPDDQIVLFDQGRQLYEQAEGEKRFVELRGGHNDNFHNSRDIYEEAWMEFIAQLNQ